MTKEDFQKLWTLNYPDTVPISYLFKHDYTDRWFRIHSLPESKRYPEDENEWQVLLSRQNEIITDLFGLETQILIANDLGFFKNDDFNLIYSEIKHIQNMLAKLKQKFNTQTF